MLYPFVTFSLHPEVSGKSPVRQVEGTTNQGYGLLLNMGMATHIVYICMYMGMSENGVYPQL